MSHFLLVWELGGNRGHLERLQVAAKVLAQQGHKITFVVRDVLKAQPWLDERGWVCVAAPRSAQSQWALGPPSCHAEWYLREGFQQAGVAQQFLQHWQALLDAVQPDAALLDYAPFAAYALHAHNIPFLTLGSGFCTPPEAAKSNCFRPWEVDAVMKAEKADAQLSQVFKQLQASIGPYAASHMNELFVPDRVALCLFEEMDHFSRSPQHHQFHGAIWASHSANSIEGSPAWNDQLALPKVFCYLNGAAQEVLSVLNELRHAPFQTIAVAPKLSADEVASLQSQYLHISAQALDVRPLLAQCQACISHGGLALCALSLQLGVPLLLFPQYAEQVLLARQLKRRGLALPATLRQSAGRIMQLIQSLLSQPSFAWRAASFAKKYQGITPEHAVQSALSTAPWYAKLQGAA